MREIYQTKDIHVAAYIYAHTSITFAGLLDDGHDCLFQFQPANKARELSEQYYNRSGNIDAKKYVDALKTCKDILFNRLRERRAEFS